MQAINLPLTIPVTSPPHRVEILATVCDWFSDAERVFTGTDEFAAHRINRGGFDVLFIHQGREYRGGGWRSIDIKDLRGQTVFSAVVHDEKQEYEIKTCRRGDWRSRFMDAA